MLNEERRESQGARRVRTVLQVAACALLILMFVAAATAAVDAPQAGAAAAPADRTPSLRNQSSDILRTSTPTLTPTRRASSSAWLPASPQNIPGQPTVDANTIALYHFDSPAGTNAIDATGYYTGTLFGNAVIADSGVYAGALQLDGNGSYVSTGQFSDPFTKGTIEAYVDFSQACIAPDVAFPIITVIGPSGTILKLQENVGLHFGIYANNQWQWVDSGINGCRYLEAGHSGNPNPWQNVPVLWPYEAWRFHHVAGTWGPRGMEIWVDGVLHGVGNTATQKFPYPYMCNPQMQESAAPDFSQNVPWTPNPIYPACQTPVMAPMMPAYPPGDYVGALPSYTTFLIGYDPSIPTSSTSNPYFTGRIDEVRISNIQRTFSSTVDPTITPTPTWTPVSLSGEYHVDASTLALFHLNPAPPHETWEEVSQQYRVLGGQAAIVAGGRFSSGLELDGNGSYLDPGNLGSQGAGTVEAWVRLDGSFSTQPLFKTAQYYNGDGASLFFGATSSNQLLLAISNGIGSYSVSTPLPTGLPGCWHHMAGTWGTRGLEVWIDGSLRNVNNTFSGGMVNQVFGWRVGCNFSGNCTKGTLDEVRVSSIQRTFAPAGLRPIRANPSNAGFTPTLGVVRTPFSNFGSSFFEYLPFIAVAPTPAPCG